MQKINCNNKKLDIITLIISIAVSLLSIIFVAFTNIPFGVEGEWVWQRAPKNIFSLNNSFIIFFIFIISITAAWYIDSNLKFLKRKVFFLAVILFLSIFSNYHILKCGWIEESESVYGILDKWTGGYLTSASEIKDLGEYLKNFQKKQLEVESGKWVLHTHTHPPGNILLSYAVLSFIRNTPPVKNLLNFIMPENFKIFYNFIKSKKIKKAHTGIENFKNLFYTAILIFYIFLFGIFLANVIILTAVYIFSGASNYFGFLAIALTLIPGPVLFLGHYDVFYYLLSSIAVLIFVLSYKYKFKIYSFILGFWLGICVFFSVSYSLIIILFGLYFLIKSSRNKENLKKIFYFISGGILFIIFCYFLKIDIINIVFKCSSNNTAFYLTTAERSSLWIPYNILDYIIFSGTLPFFFILSKMRLKDTKQCNLMLINWLLVFILGFIFLFPYSRGEIGRLALFIYPVNLFIFGAFLSTETVKKLQKKMFFLFLFILLLQTVILKSYLKLIIFF